jgi:uncharacterized protein (TIGR02145 family)/uncharacterized repeat protein (TIGR02543 family)
MNFFTRKGRALLVIAAVLAVGTAGWLAGCGDGGGSGVTNTPAGQYTITFNANGGTVSPASGTTGTNGKLTITLPKPTKSGYTFDGWFTAATGGSAVTAGTVFNSNATIYARWTESTPAEQYTITFNANGGTVSPTSGTTGADGELVSLPTPTKSGYTFDGWFTAATGGKEVRRYTVFNSNDTIYARWTESTPGRMPTINGDTLIDTDGQKYKLVTIGGQTWMARNLNYHKPGETDNSWCYENADSNCVKYGRLYDWKTAMKACPAGWHLPSRAEWDTLVTVAGGTYVAGKKLKAKSGWNDYNGVSGNGTDEFGFSALPSGYRHYGGRFGNAGNQGHWWTASAEYGDIFADDRIMSYNGDYVAEGSNLKEYGFAVRCVGD